MGHGGVYLKTGLDVFGALDPSDTDEIRVVPHPLQQAVLDDAGSLGFRLYQAESEYDPRKGDPYLFSQQLEFLSRPRPAYNLSRMALTIKVSPAAF